MWSIQMILLFAVRNTILCLLLPVAAAAAAAVASDYVPPEDRSSSTATSTTTGLLQGIALGFFITTFLLLAGYAIWLHRELAKVTVQRIFGSTITAPLLSSSPQANDCDDDDERMTTSESVELQYRRGDYQGPSCECP